MLGCTIKGFVSTCSTVTGGVSDLWVGDANDFDFTAGAADSDGDATGYSAVARRTGATAGGGAYLYPIQSVIDTIGVEISQSNADGSASAWEYVIAARIAQLSQAMTNFNKKMDAASVCCELVFVWRNNDGKIFVAGEKYVGGARVVGFRFRQDGSKIQTGKKFTEFNGQDLSFKSSYLRPPYEFTGGIVSIDAFVADENGDSTP
jgi:hypothetical protein